MLTCSHYWNVSKQTTRYVVPTGRVIVPAGSVIVATGRNIKKSLRRDSKGEILILPPVSFEEQVAVQKETKARTLLLQSLPEDHMADFHHLDDAREICLAVKARFGGNEESKKIRKTMLKQECLEFSVSEEEGLHKGYDRALPPSWSQVALTLKTRGGLEYLSFDDLYNKLMALEIDVKGGSIYGSRGTTVAPTHFAFIGAASTNTKMVYSDQLSHSSSITYTFAHSGSIIEDVLHSFIAENKPTQQLAYEDFKQVDQLEMEELDINWQMAMLSLRINRFQKKAGRKINFNNKDPAIFDRRKARCYNCLQLGYFARECNVKKVDEKARYSAFKISEVKTEEPKAMSDFGDLAGSVYDAAAEFSMMGISPKLEETLARFDKWKESSKNLAKLINSSMSTRTKLGLGFKEYIGSDEVFDLSTPSIFDPKPENKEVKSLYERFVKAGEMHKVPPSITGTFMPTSYKSNLEETLVTFGSKSNTSSINTSESNDFFSCDNSDKSSELETYEFASYVLSPKNNDTLSTVNVKILPKSDVKDPSPTNGSPRCSFKENVKPRRNLCNKSGIADRIHCKNNFVRTKTLFVCGTSISAGRSILAASRNRPASIHAGRHILAGRFTKPAPFPAGRSVPTELASPEQTATGKDVSNPFMVVMVCQKPLGYFSSPMIHVPRAELVINPPGYVVPTGRVIVPAGRYIVPTNSVIVATGSFAAETTGVLSESMKRKFCV
nr:ribonuclease H-like domain-containing protein [Tanacetum cinerariifolium]